MHGMGGWMMEIIHQHPSILLEICAPWQLGAKDEAGQIDEMIAAAQYGLHLWDRGVWGSDIGHPID